MKTLRAGTLRHSVQLQQLGTRVDDGYAGGSIPFTDVATVWAAIEPLEGFEKLEAGQFDASLSHRIRIRYYPGVRPNWRVVYGTRVFDIKSIADLEERHREMELMCEELVTW